jgi:TolB-like protein/cytochrome c-type biogenesis protein CcmH/NrfG
MRLNYLANGAYRMSHNEPPSPTPLGESRPDNFLDSWKEIATYLEREVRTVQRWEKKEGLPVRRQTHEKMGTVYAYKSEIDAWWKERQPRMEPEAEQEERVVSGRKWRMRWPIVGGLLALVGLVSIEAYLAGNRRWIQKQATTQKIKLAVLPFVNLSGDPNQQYFSDGMTEEIITQLGKLDPERLGVIAAESSKLLAGKPIAEVGRVLGVQYAIEGSVRRGGNQVRIDVQLIQISDQTHVWADSYTRGLVDVLRVQDQVAATVASQIRVAVPVSGVGTNRAARTVSRSINPEAYDAYLRGRFFSAGVDLHKSIEAYQEAIEKDPQFALAYAGLASSLTRRGMAPLDDLSPMEAQPMARRAAEHALRLDPQLAEAHAVLANISLRYDWDFEAAEREFSRAFALDPNNPDAHRNYVTYLTARNQMQRAQEETTLALDLDPIWPLFNTFRAEIFYYARDYDSAIARAHGIIEQYPNYWLSYIWLGSSYREKKMYRKAVEAFTQGRKLSGDRPVLIALYGHSLALSGDAIGARESLAELRRLAQSHYVSPLYVAMIYVGLDEKSTALDWLERAYAERSDRLIYLLVEPAADPLRSEPRFRDLLRRIGLTP